MARTAPKVERLADEGEAMTDALAAVLSVAEEKGTVTWSDVSDDITSGEWGRLIESGLLVDADGEGFVVDDPEGVHEALEEADAAPAEDDDDGSWSTWDKLAGLATLGLFAGYSLTSVRDAIGGVIDIALGPLAETVPFYVVILVLAVFTGSTSSILQDQLMDMSGMGDHQEKMQDLKERREAAKERGDDEALDRLEEEQMELMTDQMGMFKQQFRPMVWIMLINIPIFLWLYWMVFGAGMSLEAPVVTFPILGDVGSWQEGAAGPLQAWILWYFLCSLSFTQIIRKALNVETTPTGS
ncbi:MULTISPECIES: DUF106 domain-containing protein [Haloarcula]|uniref:HtlB n=1 Tax=Haloarcula pellucida TaxID=1427151 RepID=A0A830GL64_9EURY|nr:MULTISPECIES: DUF106 domain-containing protein [Halomicroarcula]MBX0348407.1 DUF106 domain-containing protein [Halomicroarcula pellucida]MDS0278231.1 DUF106 domain-containing protein [Halomicroarcula sp. S1AR25-4]GGN93517.1 HtlB [Halomicroarcula pellucida]